MSSTTCCTFSTLPPIPASLTTERLYTTKEAAEYLKVGGRTLAKFITSHRANKLKASWVGRQWLITESSLRDFIKANEQDESVKK